MLAMFGPRCRELPAKMCRSLMLLCLALAGALGETMNFHAAANGTEMKHSFEVDYSNNQFLLDGEPFRYVSGSFHYFRTPSQYWRDRLRKMRAAGLNAVSTYVEWSLHQPEEDTWNWSGDADLVEFINIAQQEDLLVLLRPGPYICAERDFGGFPYWLLSRVPDIQLRTNDPRYMRYVEIYLSKVFEKVKPLLRVNGGPIIMVQVENEYGSYNACDAGYMNRLLAIMRENVGNGTVLYTTDGNSANMLRCGYTPGAYATVDFGSGADVTESFRVMRMFQPQGPLVNSEYYPGWLTHWKEPFQRVKTRRVKRTLDEILATGASVNIYMFYGGTNFGYTSGANGDRNQYSPQLTSYDYDAPLTEAGDPTDKYFQIRSVIAKYLPMPNISTPTPSPKGNYGSVLLETVTRLLDPSSRALFGSGTVTANEPLTFEALSLPHLLVLYEAYLPVASVGDPMVLQAFVRDRALVYVDGLLAGTLSRMERIYSVPLESPYGRKLQLLVENQGHLNYGDEIKDFKGISNVTVNGVRLGPWNMTGFRLDDVSNVRSVSPGPEGNGTLLHGPVFLQGFFTVPGQPLDTYLDTSGWGKGVAFVNGHNLGRYWPPAGPQITLYVPAPYLRSGTNSLVVLEMERVPSTRKMKLQDSANLGVKSRDNADDWAYAEDE